MLDLRSGSLERGDLLWETDCIAELRQNSTPSIRGVIPIPMYQNLSLLADKRVVTVRLWYLGIWMFGGRWQETVKIQPVGNEPNKILT